MTIHRLPLPQVVRAKPYHKANINELLLDAGIEASACARNYTTSTTGHR